MKRFLILVTVLFVGSVLFATPINFTLNEVPSFGSMNTLIGTQANPFNNDFPYEVWADGGNGTIDFVNGAQTGDDFLMSQNGGTGLISQVVPFWPGIGATYYDPGTPGVVCQGDYIYVIIYNGSARDVSTHYVIFNGMKQVPSANGTANVFTDPDIGGFTDWLPLSTGPTSWSVGGTVLLDDGVTPLQDVEITYNQVVLAGRSRTPQKAVRASNNSRDTMLTGVDGSYSFMADDGTEWNAAASKPGYTFTPADYQAIITADVTDWDFTATMSNQTPPAGGSSPAPGDPVLINPDPINLNGTLVNTTVNVVPPGGQSANVVVTVSNSNPAVPVPGNVDLSFSIDVTGVTGPVTITLTFPILVPPIQNIIFFDGANWVPVPGADWSTPGEVTFTYDFGAGGPRAIEDFVVGSENPLPVTLSSFTASVIQNEFVSLDWTTQSETNMLGYKVYRSLGSIDQADFVSDLIEAENNTIETNYNFEDHEVEALTTYNYWLQSIDNDGSTQNFGPLSVEIEEELIPELPQETMLKGNYPNPFNPTTFIKFDVKENEKATLYIYNMKGQTVETKTFEAGTYNYEWNADTISSGVYFYKLQSDSYRKIKKMLLLK